MVGCGVKEGFWLLVLKMRPGPVAKGQNYVRVCGSLCMGALQPDCFFFTDFHCLPWLINVSESQGPGTVLQFFSLNCSSYLPTLKLLRVQPPTTFFNPPSLSRWQGIYVVQVGSWAQLVAGENKDRP